MISPEELGATIFIQQLALKYRLHEYSNQELTRMNYLLNRAEHEITGKLHAQPAGSFTQARQLEMLDEVRQMTAATKQIMTGNLAATAADVSVLAAKEHSRILSFDGAAKNVSRITLSPGQMESYWRSTPVGGGLLSDWINRAFDKNTVDKIRDEILIGTFKAETPNQLAARLVTGFGMAKHEAQTLTLTYVATANMDALQRTFEANKELIKSVRWRATGDANTCLVCASLDGKTYPVDDHPQIPSHPRCRCSLQPKLTQQAIGLIDEDYGAYIQTNGINPQKYRLNGRALIQAGNRPGLSVSEWIMKQEPEVRRAMLGPRRFELLEAGIIEWDDLVDLNTLKVRRLEELTAKRAGELGIGHEEMQSRAATIAKVTVRADESHVSRQDVESRLAFALWTFGHLVALGEVQKIKKKQLERINALQRKLGVKLSDYRSLEQQAKAGQL